jgi:hypothetical protein
MGKEMIVLKSTNEPKPTDKSSKYPRKKNEEEIVMERRGCFTSEELI